MHDIYVIGGNHHNTLGVVRSLGYKGIKSILIYMSVEADGYVLHSRYVKEVIKVKDKDELLEVLLSVNTPQKPVVIACNDVVSSLLDINKDSLIEKYYIPCSIIQGRITHFMNKEIMSEKGREVGFNVPKSWVVKTLLDIEEVEYPCITKPILSNAGHKSDIKICSNKQELIDLINTSKCKEFQVQKFINKLFEYQLIGLSLNDGSEIIIPGVSRCIRPCPGTNTGFLHYESLDEFNAPLDKCKKFIKAIGYSGPFSMEFIRDQENNDYFMEMNFRNDGNSMCVTASGTNLPYIWFLACTGGDYQREICNSSFRPVYVMPEFADFSCFVRNGKISWLKWIKDILKTDKFLEFDKKDVTPFFYEIRSILKRKLKKNDIYL